MKDFNALSTLITALSKMKDVEPSSTSLKKGKRFQLVIPNAPAFHGQGKRAKNIEAHRVWKEEWTVQGTSGHDLIFMGCQFDDKFVRRLSCFSGRFVGDIVEMEHFICQMAHGHAKLITKAGQKTLFVSPELAKAITEAL